MACVCELRGRVWPGMCGGHIEGTTMRTARRRAVNHQSVSGLMISAQHTFQSQRGTPEPHLDRQTRERVDAVGWL